MTSERCRTLARMRDSDAMITYIIIEACYTLNRRY